MVKSSPVLLSCWGSHSWYWEEPTFYKTGTEKFRHPVQRFSFISSFQQALNILLWALPENKFFGWYVFWQLKQFRLINTVEIKSKPGYIETISWKVLFVGWYHRNLVWILKNGFCLPYNFNSKRFLLWIETEPFQ